MPSLWITAVVLAATAAVLVLRGSSHSPGPPDDPQLVALVERLTALGYFCFTPDGAPPPGPAADALWGPASRRIFPIDAEEIAEGAASEVLAYALPLLGEAAIAGARDRLGRVGGVVRYDVIVGERTFPILGHAEFDDARRWEIAAARALAMLDALLEAAGVPERAFWLSGAEDGVAAFLTPEQAQALRACPAVADKPRRSFGDRFEPA